MHRRFRRYRRRSHQVTSFRCLFLFVLTLGRKPLRLGRTRLGRRAPQDWGRDVKTCPEQAQSKRMPRLMRPRGSAGNEETPTKRRR